MPSAFIWVDPWHPLSIHSVVRKSAVALCFGTTKLNSNSFFIALLVAPKGLGSRCHHGSQGPAVRGR